MSSFYAIFLATIEKAENGDDSDEWEEVAWTRQNAIAEELHRIADALEQIAESQRRIAESQIDPDSRWLELG
jgi:hypothetical protein